MELNNCVRRTKPANSQPQKKWVLSGQNSAGKVITGARPSWFVNQWISRAWLTNQSARKAIFTGLVYINKKYQLQSYRTLVLKNSSIYSTSTDSWKNKDIFHLEVKSILHTNICLQMMGQGLQNIRAWKLSEMIKISVDEVIYRLKGNWSRVRKSVEERASGALHIFLGLCSLP